MTCCCLSVCVCVQAAKAEYERVKSELKVFKEKYATKLNEAAIEIDGLKRHAAKLEAELDMMRVGAGDGHELRT